MSCYVFCVIYSSPWERTVVIGIRRQFVINDALRRSLGRHVDSSRHSDLRSRRDWKWVRRADRRRIVVVAVTTGLVARATWGLTVRSRGCSFRSMDGVGEIKLFAYGSLLSGESHHSALEGCRFLGNAQTEEGYRLVELQLFPCMVSSGLRKVEGELYAVDRKKLLELDRIKENGSLFFRRTIRLASGDEAEAYLMDEEQVRGRRRLHVDSWKDRFRPRSARSL